MKNYAMIVDNRVIEVLLGQKAEPHWGPVPGGTSVVAVECDETVKRGMIYDFETGEFTRPVHASSEETKKPISQLDRIEEKLNSLTADSVTMESIETAIAEGVNEV